VESLQCLDYADTLGVVGRFELYASSCFGLDCGVIVV
jgi:hypothetical protein